MFHDPASLSSPLVTFGELAWPEEATDVEGSKGVGWGAELPN